MTPLPTEWPLLPYCVSGQCQRCASNCDCDPGFFCKGGNCLKDPKWDPSGQNQICNGEDMPFGVAFTKVTRGAGTGGTTATGKKKPKRVCNSPFRVKKTPFGFKCVKRRRRA